MAKSSSSTRKKRPKYSSLDRARKRSKTKRAKAKKLRRYDDSDSYSTDDSRSSASISLSSEDSYRGRKSRSCIRKDAKGTKRRARSHSSSSEESLLLRKRKGSRKKVDSEVRKKTLKHKKKKKTKTKKKSRRDSSISSRSCSTGQSSSDSSDESEYGRRRGRSKKRENTLKSSKNVKSRSKKRRYRSRSGSSCSRDSGSDYWREEKVTDGNIPKRLKSVITFTKDDNEERELDEHKEEIIYEDDGYPSSRSNDSYDGVNKRISDNQSPVASETKRSTENEKTEDPFDIKTTELSSRYLGGDDQAVEGKPASDGFGTNDSLGEKTDEIAKTSGKVNDDLETILRQKALENLKRFRGVNARNNATKKDEDCGALKSPCPRKADLSQNDPKDEGVEGDSVHYVQEEKIVDGKHGGNGSTSVENNVCLTNNIDVAKTDKVHTTLRRGFNKQRLVTSALNQALSNRTTSTVEAPKVNLVNENGSDKVGVTCVGGKTNSDKVNNAAAKSSTGVDAGLNRLQGEDEERPRVEQRSTARDDACGSNSAAQASEGQADSKEGSQLERKTMSVMRGGEMVQVSYKVYIPKKAPALARRQLKR
ncbi:uncharacterized protein [Euphorbia lathyris]|uniref:uncharacterized protein n=1 Tax=Euphorbia lathyris TaxID=212925 RepID=UPI00331350A8